MKKTVELTFDELYNIIVAEDSEDCIDQGGYGLSSDFLQSALEAKIDLPNHAKQAVLGIDVYRYSLFKPLQQSLIPFVFHLLYSDAYRLAQSGSPYLFQKCTDEEIAERFIDTGDGGFLLFDTPIHALVYAIFFELVLRAFNSFRVHPRLRHIIGMDISLRYAMSLDGAFRYAGNFFGPSIITNARMLSKDHLNRFLIDQNTFDWFTRSTKGIENLACIDLQYLQSLPEFAEYDLAKANGDMETPFPLSRLPGAASRWKDIDVLKLGDVVAKTQAVSAYGLHIHFVATLGLNLFNMEKSSEFTITLGNLNTSGID